MRIVHLSDLHVGKTDGEWPAFLELARRTAALRPDVVVVSGDLVEVPDDAATLRQVREVLDELGVPYVTVPGNHDVKTPGENAVYEAEFGAVPRVERVGDALFLMFDSFGGLPVADRTDEDRECFENTGCWLDGRVDSPQFVAMQRCLGAGERWRLAVVHHHLEPSPEAQVNALQNADEFVRWCAGHGVSYVFVGHLHETAEPANLSGVTRLRVGRSTKAPYPIGLLDLATGAFELSDGMS